jgi:hypothetical protein
MEKLQAGDLTIDVNAPEPPAALQLTWRGKSDDRYPGKVLAPYFSSCLEEAQRRNSPIEMHFEHLEHFNSSTISAIIRFLQDARVKNIRLVIIYNQALKWQKLSFDALRVFAKDTLLELRSL